MMMTDPAVSKGSEPNEQWEDADADADVDVAVAVDVDVDVDDVLLSKRDRQ